MSDPHVIFSTPELSMSLTMLPGGVVEICQPCPILGDVRVFLPREAIGELIGALAAVHGEG